nr:MAG TPA: CotH kinase protein [Caudoviricetes sp.]
MTEYISKVQDEDTGKIAYFKDSKAREDIETLNSQFKDIANLEGIGFTSTNLKGILQEIYNVLSNNNLIDRFNIVTGNNIPEVYLTGDISTMSKANAIDLAITVRINGFEWTGTSNTKWQGNSSLAYDKKNFTIKLYEDSTKLNKQKINFNGWGKQNKFVLKANYIDHSHARNIVSAKIWSEIVKSRSDYNSLPQELRESPNNCAIDGFPVKVTVNGVYQGIYTWNIPKDAWMFNMDDTNPNHAVLCAEINNNGNNNLSNACEFRENANINGADWSLEIPDILNNNIKVSFNELINCIKNTTDNQFIYNIEKYLDIQSAIDYYIFQYYICGLDGLAKNLIMMTYDGIKWLCSSYDMDSTFGLYFDGSKFVNSNYQCPEQYQETNSLLWQRIEKCFAKQLKERYTKLRTNILSVEHITKLFNDFMSIIGNELYAKDLEVYPSIPQGNINHLQQITDFVTARSAYVDSEINSLVEYDFSQVPVTTLELDKQNINLNMSSNIQNVDLSSITKYSGKEIYNNVENSTTDTSKILTDFIEIDYSKINLYMSDSANDNTRFGYYSSKEDKNPSATTIKLINKEGNGYISNSTYPYIKLMSDDNFANEKLISIDKNYIESMLKDMDLSSLDSTNQSDKYIPVTVSKGDVVFCRPSKAGYWNAIGTADNGIGHVQNNNTANLIVYLINKDTTTVYIKIQNSLLTSDDTLKYAILHSKDLKVNTTQNITATLSPSDATNQNVTWATDNANVELVPNGLNCTIKAKAIGSSVITCTSEDTTNGTISDTCNIIIN